VVGFEGAIVHDTAKPNGTPRKLMKTEKIRALDWHPNIPLGQGLVSAYHWFLRSARAD
jgi:GDP-L-fucose synthase